MDPQPDTRGNAAVSCRTGCGRKARYRGLCQVCGPLHPRSPELWLCVCDTPDPIYLPGFDDPHHPEHRGYYCGTCKRPPIDGLHPHAQMRHRNTSHGKTFTPSHTAH